MFKNAESNADLKGLDAASLVTEHVHEQSSQSGWTFRERSLPHGDDLAEKEHIVPEPEEEVARKKRISQKKQKKQRSVTWT